ncbi:hypothetical protein HMPREF1635_05185 [Clostridiales bacterium S5-A14a]|nr:hypothetical protein HMPREF1635_05185 [Clostridiales bacterium S5-A14a]
MIKYTHGGDIYKYDDKLLDFSANINPLGMPESAKNAIIDGINKYQTYPDHSSRKLRNSLSEFYGFDSNKIVCGNGAADLIFRICLALRPQKVLVTSPTFSEYEEAVLISGGKVHNHLLRESENYDVTLEILESIDEDTDMVFLCSPNNPTGRAIDLNIIEAVLNKLQGNKGILVLDQCFVHFMVEEEKYFAINLLKKYDNFIILGAFTKIFAMAGLRLGYALFGSEDNASKIENTLQPWAVSTVASEAGCAALNKDFIKETKDYVKYQREFLFQHLSDLGIKVFESQANYMLIKVGEKFDDGDLADLAIKHRILIRKCSNFKGLSPSFFRIAVRTEAENTTLIDVLSHIFCETINR